MSVQLTNAIHRHCVVANDHERILKNKILLNQHSIAICQDFIDFTNFHIFGYEMIFAKIMFPGAAHRIPPIVQFLFSIRFSGIETDYLKFLLICIKIYLKETIYGIIY